MAGNPEKEMYLEYLRRKRNRTRVVENERVMPTNRALRMAKYRHGLAKLDPKPLHEYDEVLDTKPLPPRHLYKIRGHSDDEFDETGSPRKPRSQRWDNIEI